MNNPVKGNRQRSFSGYYNGQRRVSRSEVRLSKPKKTKLAPEKKPRANRQSDSAPVVEVNTLTDLNDSDVEMEAVSADSNGIKTRRKRGVPEGVFRQCPKCKETIIRREAEERLHICPKCDHHFTMPAQARIESLLDPDSFEEWFTELRSLDPIKFVDRKPYSERLKDEMAKTGLTEAAVAGRGFIRGRPVVLAITDFSFMAGSMGSVVGEKLTRAVEKATELKLPLIIVSGSGGGARMQESILSLMQMAKVCAALARFDQAGGLYISVLTNPTMGGAAASFATIGDIIVAEPKAMIGFAGKRTIWNTVRMELPDGFQTSEFLMEHGFLDRIIHRSELRTEIARLIDYCEKG